MELVGFVLIMIEKNGGDTGIWNEIHFTALHTCCRYFHSFSVGPNPQQSTTVENVFRFWGMESGQRRFWPG